MALASGGKSKNNSLAMQLTKPGQHDRNPVTTKHEKRSHANHLFAVSYGSFQGRPFRSLRGGERNRDISTVGELVKRP